MTEYIYCSYLDFADEYKDLAYVPDNSEDGEPFYWEDFVRETLGNITYAQELIARDDLWAYPSTMIDEDVQNGNIVFDEEDGTLCYNEDVVGEVKTCYYDRTFFDLENLLYR